ncbi:PDDEXK family nuclease [Raineya orbicola]|jgi:very-short-patch-repair endonuclease|uniref:DUF559 domain-containing protein n=1 Tax=Raineya orbicola TaxID=2016530 RepID=A0A2N3IJ44_9BACT|nr:hypothetical protein [Raineya orbicola]PKQ70370.1 hypothetical protein Rain11_0598 [Raineya orbicola]
MLIAIIVGLLLVALFFSKNISEKKPSSASRSYPLVYVGNFSNPQLPEEAKNENKGKSEAYFQKYLQKYFPKQIYTDVALRIGENFYFPDFALINRKHNLFVDIEIDEPYGFRGKSIHTIGSDEPRNAFFVEKGWIVIRFAEEQVIREPLQCCGFIAQTLAKLVKDENLNEIAKNLPHLTLFPKMWNSREAQKMFENRYRDTYLNELN